MSLKKVKIGSLVEIIAGSEKGEKGNVLELDRQKMRVKVQGRCLQTHFDKKEGLKKVEGFIHFSNIRFVAGADKPSSSSKTKGTAKAAQA